MSIDQAHDPLWWLGTWPNQGMERVCLCIASLVNSGTNPRPSFPLVDRDDLTLTTMNTPSTYVLTSLVIVLRLYNAG